MYILLTIHLTYRNAEGVVCLFSVLAVAVALLPDVQVHWGSTAACQFYTQGTDTVFDCVAHDPPLEFVPTNVPIDTTLLTLRTNRISSVSQADFTGLINVAILRMEWNRLTSIPANAFSELVSLHGLLLGYNQISVVDPDALRGLPLLTNLGLLYNQIVTLPETLLSDNVNLKGLSIGSNLITNIHPNLLNGLDN